MNGNLLHSDFLDHHAIAETSKQQADGMENQDDTLQEDTEICCDRCTKNSSGKEFNGLAFKEANSHSIESHDSSVKNSSVRHKSRSKSNSEQLKCSRSHEKLMMVIREMKQYLPTEKVESCTKTSTISALSYASKWVQRVQNSKTFPFWGECGSYQTDASVYSIEELAAVTSEHAPKNTNQDGEDSGNNDNHSVSSELFDLLLHEDSHSGSGSAASASGFAESSSVISGSNGSSSNGTSACGTAGSGNSSKYFASNDSSEVSKRVKKNGEEARQGESCQPTRIEEEVLKGDLEKLAAMTKQQPRFTKGQKEELAEVHPWIRTQTIPQEINSQGCITCDSRNASCKVIAPIDEDI